MTTTYAFLIALGEARSCLVALADSTDDFDLAIHYDHLLIELDGVTGDVGPACSPMTGTNTELLDRLEVAVDAMHRLGTPDGLSLEILLDSARNPTCVGGRCQD